MADQPNSRPHIEKVSVRRAPKLSVFLLLGAAVGVVVAMILTFAFGGGEVVTTSGVTYTPLQVFGFLALYCVPIGLAVFGLIAVWLDRRAARRAREVLVDHERIQVTDDPEA
ncbi:potassium transporter Trk [Microbacterium fluvii]|uniref:Potassium transporter Trk n=1 Tax=Microbacterium fluvii TaxID=415215 RepID=A0ABW2HIA7_9MICO|nr:potassium transporter Trk [Microbacterium fluvii]MCU4673876.1 potassium transporter Trk [Microbacterium fluvii]